MFRNLRAEIESIVDNAIMTCWYMRGCIDYFDYYELTYVERQKINSFLDKRFKEEMKKPPTMNRVY